MRRLASAGHRVVLVVATGGELGLVPDGVGHIAVGGRAGGGAWRRGGSAETDDGRRPPGRRPRGLARLPRLGHGRRRRQRRARARSGRPTSTEATDRLAAVLREEAPAAVVVYDAFGIYGHPDHVQVHRVGHRAAVRRRRADRLRRHGRPRVPALRRDAPGRGGDPRRRPRPRPVAHRRVVGRDRHHRRRPRRARRQADGDGAARQPDPRVDVAPCSCPPTTSPRSTGGSGTCGPGRPDRSTRLRLTRALGDACHGPSSGRRRGRRPPPRRHRRPASPRAVRAVRPSRKAPSSSAMTMRAADRAAAGSAPASTRGGPRASRSSRRRPRHRPRAGARWCWPPRGPRWRPGTRRRSRWLVEHDRRRLEHGPRAGHDVVLAVEDPEHQVAVDDAGPLDGRRAQLLLAAPEVVVHRSERRARPPPTTCFMAVPV